MIYLENPLSVSSSDIRSVIADSGFVVFKDFINIDMETLRDRLCDLSNPLPDKPSKLNLSNPISVFKKINLGDFGEFGEFPRFFRTIYTPYWLDGCEFTSHLFKPLIKLRNHIADLPLDFALKPDLGKSVWSGCRFQHYFSGGGFFSEHRDIIVEKISNKISAPTIQLVALISSKGTDFEFGGATIRNSKGELNNIEDYAKSGDVIAYDANSTHGVLPIDQHKQLDFNIRTGRLVALASLYNIM